MSRKPRTKQRYRRLVLAYSSPLFATADIALAIFFALVCLVIMVCTTNQWAFLTLSLPLVVMMLDANRSQKETTKLYSMVYDDDTCDSLSHDDMQWIYTRARRRFIGMLALLLAAFIMAFLPLIGVSADKYECDADPACIWGSPLS